VIGYCTNIHPTFRPDFWRRVGAPVGLWLPAHEVEHADKELLKEFRVFTMNGFPYGNFHSESVKYSVYEPNWCDPRRASYTFDLARLICDISCVEEPTISTLPLGWGLWDAEIDEAARALRELAVKLQWLSRPVRICLEPEPGCALESAADVVRFFGRLGDSDAVRRHIGVCWDTCHHAVIFEPPEKVALLYREAGITVGKMQVSNAPVLAHPRDAAARKHFLAYDEPRYLHQTRDGAKGCDDLPQAPSTLSLDRPWRSHFHVPVFLQKNTTQDETLRALKLSPTKILEVETYTWPLLSQNEDDLIAGIRRELEWTRKNSS
jgi:hypothetical protein